MNPESTFAYLIAVENYPKDNALHPLPQSFNNVSELYKILKGPLVGIPAKSNIGRSIDPDDGRMLTLKVKKLIESPNAKTLIIYYTGHGVFDDDGNHYLTLTNSTVDNIEIDGLNIDDLSKAWAKKKNLNVILILDSCFSENAFDDFKGRNYLLMASSARNRTSKYPVEADFSAFTGEIIQIMNTGIDVDKKLLSWRDIYQHVKINLKEKGFPNPKISTQNEVESLDACANRFNIKEVNMEDRWVKIIKEDLSSANSRFHENVEGILNTGGPQVFNKLMEMLLDVFPYPIAFYLNALFDKKVEIKAVFSFYESVIRFLFLVTFMQFERLINSNKFKPGNKFRNQLLDFSEPSHEFYLSMLQLMSKEIESSKAERFIQEFDFFDPVFQEIIKGFETEKLKSESRLNNLKDLTFRLVTQLRFFINYKLLSVNNVNLNYRKYNSMEFNHSVSILQGNYQSKYEIWSRPTEVWQKAFVKNKEAKNSRSVIFIKCHEKNMGNYLNLWPLIIDKNVLEPKASIPEIFLFSGSDDKDFLYYKIGETDENKRRSYNELEALAVSTKLESFKEILRT